MKRRVRKEVLSARRAMSSEQREQENRNITDKVLSSAEFAKAETVFCYVSLDDEVNTYSILSATLEAGKILCVPYITGEKGIMLAVRLRDVSDLVAGAYGIPTAPKYDGSQEFVSPEDIDLAIVPGAAFTLDGQRIGMGGGYYDRFLEKFSGISAGIAYSCQMRETLPMEQHDRKIDIIFTDLQ